MKKIPIKLMLSMLLLLLNFGNAHAIERVVSLGQGFSLPRYIEPQATSENRSYHLNVGYYFRESVHIALSLQFALDGDQQIHLRFGPEFYLLKDSALLPWIGAKYIYTLDPASNQGWLAQFGVEKNMSFIFGFENMVLRVSSGFAYIYVDNNQNRSYFEMINLGVAFAF